MQHLVIFKLASENPAHVLAPSVTQYILIKWVYLEQEELTQEPIFSIWGVMWPRTKGYSSNAYLNEEHLSWITQKTTCEFQGVAGRIPEMIPKIECLDPWNL